MSENSELIHWHLQPCSAALLVALRGKRAPLWQNSVLPHHLATVPLPPPLQEVGSPYFYWFNLYLSGFVRLKIKALLLLPWPRQESTITLLQVLFKLFQALIKRKDLFILFYFTVQQGRRGGLLVFGDSYAHHKPLIACIWLGSRCTERRGKVIPGFVIFGVWLGNVWWIED